MKAAEAKKLSESKAAQIERERLEESAKRKAARVKSDAARRAKFVAGMYERIDDSIKFAIEHGEKSCRWYASYNCDDHVEAENGYLKHEFLDEIKKVVRKYERDGYTTTRDVAVTEHTTQHESSVPDYTYYEHHYYIEFSWK